VLIRFYYNRSEEYPYIASYDYGDISSEVKCKSIACFVPCSSMFVKREDKREPTFFMVCDGVISARDGNVHILSH